MAIKLGELSLFLTADDKSLNKALVKTEKSIQKLSDKMTKFGRTLTVGISLPLIAVGGAAIKIAADFEQAEIAMRTMLGSAEKSAQVLKELEIFAKRTPFQFQDLLVATRRMIAFGFSAKQVIPILTIVGDAAAGLGLGSEEISSMILALGRIWPSKNRAKTVKPVAIQVVEFGDSIKLAA